MCMFASSPSQNYQNIMALKINTSSHGRVPRGILLELMENDGLDGLKDRNSTPLNKIGASRTKGWTDVLHIQRLWFDSQKEGEDIIAEALRKHTEMCCCKR